MRIQSTDYMEVLATEPGQLHELLEDAEAALRQMAMRHRCAGIVVTRHDSGRYTLALSNAVPFGETHEQILS